MIDPINKRLSELHSARSETEGKSQHNFSDVIPPEILEGLNRGDPQALGYIHDTLYLSLWRFALHLVKSSSEAEDIVQDVFVSLWDRRTSIKNTFDVRSYLFTAVRNRAHDHFRHNRVVFNIESAVSASALHLSITARPEPSPDLSVERAAFMNAYRKAVSTLSDRESTILYLRWEEELTLDQISQTMGISIEGVRKIINKAQNKLQKLLSDFRG